MQKCLDIFNSGALQKFCGDLKNDLSEKLYVPVAISPSVNECGSAMSILASTNLPSTFSARMNWDFQRRITGEFRIKNFNIFCF